MRNLRSSEVCQLLAIHPSTLGKWTVDGIVRPVVDRPGRGRERTYSPTTALAVGLGRALRARGFDLAAAAAVVEVVQAHSVRDLERAFARGFTHAVAGADAPDCLVPATYRRDECALVDVKAAWQSLQHKVAVMARRAFGLSEQPA